MFTRSCNVTIELLDHIDSTCQIRQHDVVHSNLSMQAWSWPTNFKVLTMQELRSPSSPTPSTLIPIVDFQMVDKYYNTTCQFSSGRQMRWHHSSRNEVMGIMIIGCRLKGWNEFWFTKIQRSITIIFFSWTLKHTVHFSNTFTNSLIHVLHCSLTNTSHPLPLYWLLATSSLFACTMRELPSYI